MESRDASYQVVCLVLEHFGNALVVLRSDSESSHVRVNINGTKETSDGLVRIGFLEAVRRIHVVGGCVVARACLGVEICCLAERRASLAPLLCHLEQIGCSLVTIDGVIHTTRAAPVIKSR